MSARAAVGGDGRATKDLQPPPRQLAVGDPLFRRVGPNIRIFIDGEEVQRCTAYDLDKRTVTRQRLDAEGLIFVDPETDRVAVETVTGKVEVKWR